MNEGDLLCYTQSGLDISGRDRNGVVTTLTPERGDTFRVEGTSHGDVHVKHLQSGTTARYCNRRWFKKL